FLIDREIGMSTSGLYRALGVRGYKHVSLRQVEGEVLLKAEHDGQPCACPDCGGSNVRRRGTAPRSWRLPPIGQRPVTLFAAVPRVECRDCQATRVVPAPFADPQRSYSRSFERMVLDLRRSMTLRDVARHLGISDWMVRDIETRWLGKKFAKPKLRRLRTLAIDEISVKKGRKFLTIVMDLQSGAVVFVGDGKGAEALKPFWKRLKSSGAKVEAVAMDMSAAYDQAVTEHLPQAAVVFDWFHIVKLLNDKLSELRRQLHREATDTLHKDVLKGTRWLLLKRPENLDDERNEFARLQEALHLNQSLATAYYLKEELPLVFQQATKGAASRFLDDWIARAFASGVQVLRTFARTLAAYRSGVLAWYDHPISTGPLEGTNNKIKTLKRQAYGYRDQEYFKLKILALHLTKYELVG
ncbi:MAG: ISL3 family transposase, partial [Pirellulales bacterium]|nr:ISL3 family transposase [Pirellulales bacterium]